MKSNKIHNIVNLLLVFVIILLIFINMFKNKYDINNDGKVDILDLLKLQKYIVERDDNKCKK